jgi:hypothetical protein
MNEEQAERAEAKNWNAGIMEWWAKNEMPKPIIPLFPFLILCVLRELCG